MPSSHPISGSLPPERPDSTACFVARKRRGCGLAVWLLCAGVRTQPGCRVGRVVQGRLSKSGTSKSRQVCGGWQRKHGSTRHCAREMANSRVPCAVQAAAASYRDRSTPSSESGLIVRSVVHSATDNVSGRACSNHMQNYKMCIVAPSYGRGGRRALCFQSPPLSHSVSLRCSAC